MLDLNIRVKARLADFLGGMASVKKRLDELNRQFGTTSAFAKIGTLLAGGGALAGVSILAKRVTEAAKEAERLAQEFRRGEIGLAQMGVEAAAQLPIVKELSEAFMGIGRAAAAFVGFETAGAELERLKRQAQLEDAAVELRERAAGQLRVESAPRNEREIAQLSEKWRTRQAELGELQRAEGLSEVARKNLQSVFELEERLFRLRMSGLRGEALHRETQDARKRFDQEQERRDSLRDSFSRAVDELEVLRRPEVVRPLAQIERERRRIEEDFGRRIRAAESTEEQDALSRTLDVLRENFALRAEEAGKDLARTMDNLREDLRGPSSRIGDPNVFGRALGPREVIPRIGNVGDDREDKQLREANRILKQIEQNTKTRNGVAVLG